MTTQITRRSILAGTAAAAAVTVLPRTGFAKELLRMSTLGPGDKPEPRDDDLCQYRKRSA